MRWYKFYQTLRAWEKKFKVKLVLSKQDFGIHKRTMARHAFKKGESVLVKIVTYGWLEDEMVGVARDRAITVRHVKANIGDKVRVRITKVKHNIYLAEPKHVQRWTTKR